MQINASFLSIENNPVFRSQNEVKEEQTFPKTDSDFPNTEVERSENIEKLQNVMAEHDLTLKFSQDQETKAIVVELVDEKTGEAIRQIPSQVSLKLAAVFVKMQGQFVDKTE